MDITGALLKCIRSNNYEGNFPLALAPRGQRACDAWKCRPLGILPLSACARNENNI